MDFSILVFLGIWVDNYSSFLDFNLATVKWWRMQWTKIWFKVFIHVYQSQFTYILFKFRLPLQRLAFRQEALFSDLFPELHLP